jgi:diaminopimelate decarboxylase
MKKLPFNAMDLKQAISKYPTPFYIYDERAIKENIHRLYKAFSWNEGFREYFAVKSTPNPYIMNIFKEEHCGAECASETELILADSCSFQGEEIMFSSSVTSAREFQKAKSLNAIINLDDFSHIQYLKECEGIPELICFRLNPGGTINYKAKEVVNLDDYKFGFTKKQFIEGVNYLKDSGIKRFGLHTQFGCHRREADYFEENARMIFEIAVDIYNNTGIKFEFINLAGGIGITYKEDQEDTDIEAVSQAIRRAYEDVERRMPGNTEGLLSQATGDITEIKIDGRN